MVSLVDKIFAVLPICRGHFWRTACFGNGSFVTRPIAVKDGCYTTSLSHGILSVVKFL